MKTYTDKNPYYFVVLISYSRATCASWKIYHSTKVWYEITTFSTPLLKKSTLSVKLFSLGSKKKGRPYKFNSIVPKINVYGQNFSLGLCPSPCPCPCSQHPIFGLNTNVIYCSKMYSSVIYFPANDSTNSDVFSLNPSAFQWESSLKISAHQA